MNFDEKLGCCRRYSNLSYWYLRYRNITSKLSDGYHPVRTYSPSLFDIFFCKELIDRNVTCLLSLARHGFSVLLHFFLWVSVVQNPRVFLGIFCRVSTFVLLRSSSQLSSPSELGLAGRNGVVFGETGR